MTEETKYIQKLDGWLSAAKPINEAERLSELQKYEILDTPASKEFDNITNLVRSLLKAKSAMVSLVDENRQWFKSACGTSLTETPRDQAFCSHTVWQDEVFVVLDTHDDERFRNSPLVTGDEKIRFYAGAPLITSNGYKIGALCVTDTKPRDKFTEEEQMILNSMSKLVMDEMRLHLSNLKLKKGPASKGE